MGQISGTETLTVEQPTSALTSWQILDSAAATLSIMFENEVLISGSNAAVVGRAYYNSSPTSAGATMIGSQTVITTAETVPNNISWSTSGIPGGSYVAGFVGANTSGNRMSIDLTLSDDLTYCDYGAQRRYGGPDIVTVTYDLALAVIGYYLTGGWGAIIGFLLGQIIHIPVLCSAVRPPLVQLANDEWLHVYGLGTAAENDAAKVKLSQFFLWAAWGYFCECTPGSPTPHQPPVINVYRPPNVPDDPLAGFTCDNNDLCTQLARVNVALNALAQRQTVIDQSLMLIQRQGVPFGYVQGTAHAGLSGQGNFAVADILGLAVDFTTLPVTYPPLGGDPDTYHTLGKVTVGTVDGWERSWWPTHAPYLILPVSGAITKVGWTFPSGIVATITELLREP